MTTNKSKPVETIRYSRLSAAIWANQTDKGKYYSFTIERNYADQDNKLKATSSFNLQDALTVAKLADQVHTRIYQLIEADKDSSVDSDAA